MKWSTLLGGIPTKQIGTSSVHGKVFSLYTRNGSKKVVKFVKGGSGKREYIVQRIASRSGVAPRVHRFVQRIILSPVDQKKLKLKYKTVDAIVMDNLVQNTRNKVVSFANYIYSNRVSTNKKRFVFKQLIHSLSKLGRIEHGDLHGENIYVVIKPDASTRIKLIDFGSSVTNKSIIKKLRRATEQERGGTYGPNNIYSMKSKLLVLNSFHLKKFKKIINSFNNNRSTSIN